MTDCPRDCLDCKLPDDFIGRNMIGDHLVRPMKEDWSGVSRSGSSWVVKYVGLLREKVWLDVCRQKSEISTHDGWRGLRGNIQSNTGMVVDSIIAMLVWRRGAIIAHDINVPRVLWLAMCSDVFDGWEHIHVWPGNTTSTGWWELKAAEAYAPS